MKNQKLLICLLFGICLQAQNHIERDQSFGVESRISFQSYDVNIQSDDKIVVVTGEISQSITLDRYTANGQIDISFGTNGTITTPLPYQIMSLSSPAFQPNGKILVTGSVVNANSETVMILLRFNPNGSLDTSFNGVGYFIFSLLQGIYSAGNFIDFQSDGKIIVGGTGDGLVFYPGNQGYTGLDAVVWRFLDNGTLDTTFNGSGWRGVDRYESASLPEAWSNEIVKGLGILSTNEIILGVHTELTNIQDDYLAFYRISANGANRSYNSYTTVNFPEEGLTAMAIQPNDQILFTKYNPYNDLSRLSRIGTDNQQDYSVDPFYNGRLYDVKVDNNKILCGGFYLTSNFTYNNLRLFRLNMDGTQDNTFNNGSYLFSEIQNALPHPVSFKKMFVQSTGGILILGDYGNEQLICRYISVSNLATDNLTKNNIVIYPNPSASYITVNGLPAPTAYKIIDFCGRTVMDGAMESYPFKIDIQALSKGTYMLSIDATLLKIIKD